MQVPDIRLSPPSSTASFDARLSFRYPAAITHISRPSPIAAGPMLKAAECIWYTVSWYAAITTTSGEYD
jgi:hypothetical protein